MKIIIHAGMGKTGSTTVQRTFSRLRQAVYAYPLADAGIANIHSRLFTLCFSAEDSILDAFPNSGDSQRQLRCKRRDLRRRLDAAMASAARPALLISTEYLSFGQGRKWNDMVRRFADYCRQHSDDMEVYAYVRPPVSYMESALPQTLRTAVDLRHAPLLQWPQYRKGFAPLDACFGRERVHLIPYDRARLKGGDVVLDFAARIKVPLHKSQVLQANESVPLETTSLLYAFRTLLPQRKPALWRAEKRNAFVAALATIGGNGKLRLAPQLVQPILQREQADLKWLTARIGQCLTEPPPAQAHEQIASLNDMLAIAEAQTEKVEALAQQTAPPGSTKRQRLLHALTALYDQQKTPL